MISIMVLVGVGVRVIVGMSEGLIVGDAEGKDGNPVVVDVGCTFPVVGEGTEMVGWRFPVVGWMTVMVGKITIVGIIVGEINGIGVGEEEVVSG